MSIFTLFNDLSYGNDILHHAWDKSTSPKLCWDNELGEIITFNFFSVFTLFNDLCYGNDILRHMGTTSRVGQIYKS